MYSFPNITEEDKQVAIDRAKELLPDDAELVLLSFTGGRAFGWGNEHHDIDVHGFFAKEDWFHRCHSMNGPQDMTLTNIYDVNEPDIRYRRWKQYYDKSNPFYVHDDFDVREDFINHAEYDTVLNVFPYDIELQIQRLETEFRDRNALHTYKELMIPNNFLENDEIDTDVGGYINGKSEFGLRGLAQCVRSYKERGNNVDLDEDLIRTEIEELYVRLENNLIEKTDYETDGEKQHLTS